MDYKQPLNKPTKFQNFVFKVKEVARAVKENKRYVPYAVFSLMFAAGCGNQNNGNKLPNSVPGIQKMNIAAAKVEVLDDYRVRVTKQNNDTLSYDFFNEMYVHKVSSLKGSTWESQDFEDGSRIYAIHPQKSSVHSKDSTATFSIILPPPADEKNAVKTKNAQL